MDEIKERLDRLRDEVGLHYHEEQRSEDVDFWNWRPMPYQIEWFEDKAQIKLILAGNQVGKTLCLIIKVIILALGILPYSLGGKRTNPVKDSRRGVEILLAGESAKAVKKTFVKKLEHFLKPEWIAKTKMGKEGFVEEYTLVTGARITIWSYAQGAATWEGPQWNFAGFDEPPKKAHFTATQRGTMKRQGEIWVTATPLKEEWMQDDLIEPAQDPTSDLYEQASYFRIDMHANCKEHNGGYIPHDRIMSYLATLTEDERAAREHGMFLARTGLDFVYVQDKSHMVEEYEIDPAWPIIEVIDPSMKRGIWCGWFVFKPDDTVDWFKAEVVPDGPLSYMSRSIHRFRAMLPSQPVMAICDQRGGAFVANKEEQRNWFEEFRRNGLIYVKSVEALHETLHDWLRPVPGGRPKLCLTKRVCSKKEGPIWACQRYRLNPLDSAKKRYGQKGKDWIDLMRYLAGHPGLSHRRLTSLKSAGPRSGPARAYSQQGPRPRDQAATIRGNTRLAIGRRRQNSLRRRGWNL